MSSSSSEQLRGRYGEGLASKAVILCPWFGWMGWMGWLGFQGCVSIADEYGDAYEVSELLPACCCGLLVCDGETGDEAGSHRVSELPTPVDALNRIPRKKVCSLSPWLSVSLLRLNRARSITATTSCSDDTMSTFTVAAFAGWSASDRRSHWRAPTAVQSEMPTFTVRVRYVVRSNLPLASPSLFVDTI